jgi:hypothetical protein
MSSNGNFVGLADKVDVIQKEYSHLVQVRNLTSQTIQVMAGAYLMGRCFALVDPNDELVKRLLDTGKIVIIAAAQEGSKQSQKSSQTLSQPEEAVSETKPKRKSKVKVAAEQKQKVDELSNLFK